MRFCCPHCDQAYYGDGEDGHLRPSRFTCIGCDRFIEESECIVRPREDGSHEDRIAPDVSPWHDPSLSAWNRFWGTVGQSMVRPTKLGRGLPQALPLSGSYLFAIMVYGLVLLFGMVPLVAMMWFLRNPGGGVPAFGTLSTGLQFLLYLPAILVVMTVYGTITHGLLRLTGPTTEGIGRTIASMGFGFGPMIVAIVPCIGPNCLQYPAGIWAMVSAILILVPSQGVSGLRACFAVLTPVLVTMGILVAMLVITINATVNAMGNLTNLPPQLLQPGNLDPGPPMMIEGHQVRLRCSVVVDRVEQAEELPTFKELMADPLVLHSGIGPVEASPTTFQGDGYQGWWIPSLMVVKGPEGAFVVTSSHSMLGAAAFHADYSIFHRDRKESIIELEGGDNQIIDAIRTSVEEVGGAAFDAKIVEAWIEGSVTSDAKEGTTGAPVETVPAGADRPDGAG